MKFNLKMIAVAAAMVAASSAHADLANNSTGNSSFALVAFNTATNAYYIRDLGYNLNSFLPNNVTTTAIDGGGSPVTGDKTPEAGLNITFGAGQFSTWLAGQTSGSILWTVAAGDGLTAAGTSNLSRGLIAASALPGTAPTNTTVRTFVNTSSGVSGLATQNNDGTAYYDKTGAAVIGGFTSNYFFGAPTALGSAASLYYYTTTAGTGSSTVAANVTGFSNSLNTATLTLASSGVLTYDLQPAVSAVPLPAAAWLMGSGLVGLAGMFRRRKAAAAAAV